MVAWCFKSAMCLIERHVTACCTPARLISNHLLPLEWISLAVQNSDQGLLVHLKLSSHGSITSSRLPAKFNLQTITEASDAIIMSRGNMGLGGLPESIPLA